MKHSLYIIFISVLLLFSFCKKKDPPGNNSSTSKINTETQAISILLKGTWTWDSTVFYNAGTAVYCFNKDQLKTYTLNTTVISCTTTCTFSLSFSSDPYNTGDGSGFVNTYEEYVNFWAARTAQTQIKGSYLNSNDSTINLDQTWGWVVGPDQNNDDVDISIISTSEPVIHKCSQSIGYLAFSGTTYVIKDVSSTQFVIQKTYTPVLGCDLARYYFHK